MTADAGRFDLRRAGRSLRELAAGTRNVRAVEVARVARRIDWPLAVPALGLMYAAVRGWLQPALHPTLSAFDLGVALPATTERPISWGLILLAAIALLVVSWLLQARIRRTCVDAAAVLAVFVTVGFIVQSWLVDEALVHRLRRDDAELDTLQRVAGFRIPHPVVTSVGPIPMPANLSAVASGLRSGFYVALASAIALAAVARRRHGDHPRASPRGVIALGAAASLLLVVDVAQAAQARSDLRQAHVEAATGRDAAAAHDFRRAVALAPGLAQNPDVQSAYGMITLHTSGPALPRHALAESRLVLDGGHDLTALQLVSRASRRWPKDQALQQEFVDQAVRYLLLRRAPAAVHATMPGNLDSALLRLTLARYELGSGDNPAAILDARSAIAVAGDTEVRSIGLTYLALAQIRSGNPQDGRRTLLAAVRADTDYVNVMARSLLTGLYTTLPI